MSGRYIFEALEREGWPLLERWVAERERESLHLEAKCAQMDEGPGKLSVKTAADIAKAISGLANAEGGVVLVGVDAQKPIDGGDDRIERITPVRGLASFARFVGERASQLTQPEVPGLRLLQIPDPANGDQGVLAVYVPSTDVGPFRTGRNLYAGKSSSKDVSERYYLRNGSNTDVMSHSLLGLMFGRRPAPSVRLSIELDMGGGRQARMRMCVENCGRGPARSTAVVIEWLPPWNLPWLPQDHCWPATLQRKQEPTVMRVTYQSPVGTTLHPEQSLQVFEALAGEGKFPRTFVLRGALYAEGMRTVRFDQEVLLRAGTITIPPEPP